MPTLSAQQLSVLQYHADAGDRIAYYTALSSFGFPYGGLALGFVLNNTVSGAAANSKRRVGNLPTTPTLTHRAVPTHFLHACRQRRPMVGTSVTLGPHWDRFIALMLQLRHLFQLPSFLLL